MKGKEVRQKEKKIHKKGEKFKSGAAKKLQ